MNFFLMIFFKIKSLYSNYGENKFIMVSQTEPEESKIQENSFMAGVDSFPILPS